MRRETGSSGGGGRFGYAHFDDSVIEGYVNDAVNAALTNLGGDILEQHRDDIDIADGPDVA